MTKISKPSSISNLKSTVKRSLKHHMALNQSKRTWSISNTNWRSNAKTRGFLKSRKSMMRIRRNSPRLRKEDVKNRGYLKKRKMRFQSLQVPKLRFRPISWLREPSLRVNRNSKLKFAATESQRNSSGRQKQRQNLKKSSWSTNLSLRPLPENSVNISTKTHKSTSRSLPRLSNSDGPILKSVSLDWNQRVTEWISQMALKSMSWTPKTCHQASLNSLRIKWRPPKTSTVCQILRRPMLQQERLRPKECLPALLRTRVSWAWMTAQTKNQRTSKVTIRCLLQSHTNKNIPN